jgi:hypothetical protein
MVGKMRVLAIEIASTLAKSTFVDFLIQPTKVGFVQVAAT